MDILRRLVLLTIAANFYAAAFSTNRNTNLRRNRIAQCLSMKLEYRNAKITDIRAISELCSESFDGPFQWHQQIQRLQSIDSFQVQLTDRLNNLVLKGIKHSMIVAIDNEKPEKSSVMGFLEIGLLPSPVAPEDPPTMSNSDLGSSETIETLESDVDQSAKLSEDVVVTDINNVGDHSDSEPTVIPAEATSVDTDSNNSSVNELVSAAETEVKRRTRRDEVPYLGNVAVSPDCRRQGVGMKLVRIGLKVTEKWGDPKLFVVVESNNIGAIKMYEKLQFACVMKEEDNINRRMDKVPRIFMSIDVPTKRVADTVL